MAQRPHRVSNEKCFLALGLALWSIQVSEQAEELKPSLAVDLSRLSLEDLGQIKVTSVSRKSESLSSAAAAVHLITLEDIRRSGANSLPDVLRLAPGLEIGQSSTRQWGVSARGFNDTFANKLLVLMDGRTLYTPLFSGVFWEEADTVLEDLDRIEVIRGPGATLWGANAVNGVINIITKSARETQGILIAGGGGIEEEGFGAVRYGAKLADGLYFRVYGKYVKRDDFTLDDGSRANDSLWSGQGGFRLDWEPSDADTVTVQGDYYSGEWGGKVLRVSYTPVPGVYPSDFRSNAGGGNMLGRWKHQFSDDSDMSWQVFYDAADRGFGIGREQRDTLDFDAQHRSRLSERHELVWGVGYRYSADDIETSPDFGMLEPSKGIQLFNLFAQDEMTLVQDRLRLTLGAKLEHNDFTGFEFQPSGRLSWTPHERHSFWAAISRAVRTPSRTERSLVTYVQPHPAAPPGILASFTANPDFGSEELFAYEVGSRVTVRPGLTLDWTAFYNVYDALRSITQNPLELKPFPVLHLELPFAIRNDLFGETYGTELSLAWQPADALRLRANYTFLEMQLHTRGGVRSVSEDLEERGVPQHQIGFRSDVNIGRHWEWGAGLRHVGGLPHWGIPGYTELETRLAWKPTKNCELAVIGRNLLHAHHREFVPLIIGVRNVEVDRAIFGKVTLRF